MFSLYNIVDRKSLALRGLVAVIFGALAIGAVVIYSRIRR